MESLTSVVGLAAFSFISAVTPGPNNVLLWASGMRFGLRRSIPHIVGTAVGIGGLAIAVAVGLGAVLAAAPALAVLMRLGGSAYLAWLAWRIARSNEVGMATLDRPMGIAAAALFQAANPKAWIFALGAISTFRPAHAGPTGDVAVAIVMMVVVLPAAGLWAGAGGVIGRLIDGPRTRRVVNVVLAAAVLATIATAWI